MGKYKATPVLLPPVLCEDVTALKRRLQVLANKCERGTTARRMLTEDIDLLIGIIGNPKYYRFKVYAGYTPFVSSWDRRNAWVTVATGKRDASGVWYVCFNRVDAHVSIIDNTPLLSAVNGQARVTWEIPQ